MGEIAEMMLDGTLCQQCGVTMPGVDEDGEAPGYPQTCADCLDDE